MKGEIYLRKSLRLQPVGPKVEARPHGSMKELFFSYLISIDPFWDILMMSPRYNQPQNEGLQKRNKKKRWGTQHNMLTRQQKGVKHFAEVKDFATHGSNLIAEKILFFNETRRNLCIHDQNSGHFFTRHGTYLDERANFMWIHHSC